MTLPYSSIVPGKPRTVQSGLLFSFDTEDGYPQIRTGQALNYSTAAASRGTCVDATGRVKVHTQSQPRLHHEYDAATGLWLPAGMLVEDVRTNGFTFSRDLSNAAWIKNAVTVATDTTKGPDSDFTAAYKVKEDATTAVHSVSRATPTLTTSTLQSFSFSAKAAERSWCYVRSTDKANATLLSWINLSTGVLGNRDSGHQLSLRRLADGWWRIYCQWASGTGATAPAVAVGVTTANATSSYAGTTGSGLYLTDLQFEVDQAVPSEVIPTTTATASRQGDNLASTHDWGLGDLTIYARQSLPLWAGWNTNLVNSKLVFMLSTGAPYLWLFWYNTGQVVYLQLTDAVPNYSQQSHAWVTTGVPEFCCQVRNLATGGQVNFDNGAGFSGWQATVQPITAWGNNTLRLGWNGASSLAASLQAVRIVAGLRSMTQMRGYR